MMAASSLALAAALLMTGCRNLKLNDKPVSGIVLPKTQMESDSVAVRVAVVELDDQQQTEFESFIETTDEKLPLETRQLLDDNGFRVAVVSNINHSRLQKMLAPAIQKPDWLAGHKLELAEAGKLEPVYRMVSHQHIERKRGEEFSVEVSPVRPQSSWLIHVGDRQYSDSASLAQCQMRVTSTPQPDGSVTLSFLPEIHHGQKRSRIGVDGSTFAVQQRRDVKELRALAFEISVSPNETVLVAPTDQLERLGDLFFNAKLPTANAAFGSDQDAVAWKYEEGEEDVDTSEFFPMLDADEMSLDAAVLVDGDQLSDTVLDGKDDRPEPWQRFLMVRVVEVTAPAVP